MGQPLLCGPNGQIRQAAVEPTQAALLLQGCGGMPTTTNGR